MRALCVFAGSLVLGSACSAATTTYAATGTLETLPAKKTKSSNGKPAFDSNEFRPFNLVSSTYETHDTRRFVFQFEDPEQLAGIPLGACIVAKITDTDGKAIVRPYTPISTTNCKGQFELMIKKYPKSKMGTHVFKMHEGESLQMKGPFVKLDYKPNKYNTIGMIAGGTGVAPMYQLIRGALENPKDETAISMIYANNSRKDVLLANELVTLQKTYPKFNMYLTLLDVPKRWLGGIGYVNEAMVKAFLPKPNEKHTIILVCGPPAMMKAISGDKDFSTPTVQQGPLSGLLKDMGYPEWQVFKY